MQRASPLRQLTFYMGSHSVTCHPADVTIPSLPQPIKDGILDLATPEGCKAEFTHIVGLVAYQDGIPPENGRSLIPVLTGLNVEQLRSSDDRRYHAQRKTANSN